MKSQKLSAACLLAALVLSAGLTAVPAQARSHHRRPRHHKHLVPRLAHARGAVQSLGGYYFTIKLRGRATGRLAAMTRAATRITAEDYPYVWGGGHGEAGVASRGERGGPGFNGRRRGFDCSGAVAAVLVAGGLWPQGGGVPSDAGVIAELRAAHLIVRGAGTGPREVTLYDYPGVHIFMNIDGRFFGTSDGAGGGDRRGGAGWLNDGAWDVHDRHFKRWHFVPSVLHERTNAGLLLTFSTGTDWGLLNGLGAGDNVSVTYTTSRVGTMLARAVTLRGERTVAGTVAAVDAAGFTLTLAGGQTRQFTPGPGVDPAGLQVGDTVTVAYTSTRSGGVRSFEARSYTVTATPTVPPPTASPPTAPPTGGGSVTPWPGG